MEDFALTRASQLVHITDTLERLGYSAERMLTRANLPMWHYCDPDDLIPTHHIHRLMSHAARNLGSPVFGLQVGLESSIASLGSYGKVIASAVSIKHALEASCRLIHLHSSDARLWLTPAGDEVWFCRNRFRGPKFGRTQVEQYVLTRLIDYVRLGAGPSWQPAKVRLQTLEAPAQDLRDVLGDPEIHIGQNYTAIAVPRGFLVLPLRHRRTPGEASNVEEARLRDTAPANHFPDALRQVAGTLMKEGTPPRVETMAEITGLSVRSLQRRLRRHGLTHIEITRQVRYQAATRLLKNPDLRVTDIGVELGYADSAHFSRAFKRWAGVSPRQYRSHKVMR